MELFKTVPHIHDGVDHRYFNEHDGYWVWLPYQNILKIFFLLSQNKMT